MNKLKKIIIGLLLSISIVGFAQNDTYSSNIVGKWKLSDFKVRDATVNGESKSVSEIRELENLMKKNKTFVIGDIIEFASNGVRYYNGQFHGIYQVNGNKLTWSEEGHSAEGSIEGNQLKLEVIFNFEDEESGITKIIINLSFTKEAGKRE